MRLLTYSFASTAQSEVAPHPEGERRANQSRSSQPEHSDEADGSAPKQSQSGHPAAEDQLEVGVSAEAANHSG